MSSGSTPQILCSWAIFSLGQRIEVIEQRLHRRIKPIAITQLQGQALFQGTGANPGRIKALQPFQDLFDKLAIAAEKRPTTSAISPLR